LPIFLLSLALLGPQTLLLLLFILTRVSAVDGLSNVSGFLMLLTSLLLLVAVAGVPTVVNISLLIMFPSVLASLLFTSMMFQLSLVLLSPLLLLLFFLLSILEFLLWQESLRHGNMFPPVLAPCLCWHSLLFQASLVLLSSLLLMYSYQCFFFQGFPAMAGVSAVAAFPTAVGFTAFVGVPADVGFPAVAVFPDDAGIPAC
jgi:hypothetical protein